MPRTPSLTFDLTFNIHFQRRKNLGISLETNSLKSQPLIKLLN